ncbi:hypothetical protein LguiB_018992 [Lonicera macranthoides]
MAMEEDDNESCGSRAVDVDSSAKQNRQQRQRLEVFNEVLTRLHDMNHEEAMLPDFEDQLWLHFNRFPARYAMDVNVERAEDVLTHKRLLHLAEDPASRPAFDVRLVQVPWGWSVRLSACLGSGRSCNSGCMGRWWSEMFGQSRLISGLNSLASIGVHPTLHGNATDSTDLDSSMKEDAQSYPNHSSLHGFHPPPTFGSSQNLDVLALQPSKSHIDEGDTTSRPMHEITFSTVDKPKLLSQLTSLLSEVGLNIQEAHAFSTLDGFSLDVFVVDGWLHEEIEQLRRALEKEISNTKGASSSKQHSLSTVNELGQTGSESINAYLKIPTDGTDVWEIDASLLKFENKVASGSFGDLYKGSYCSQEVAIKVLKPERVNLDMLREFSQEVFIMRKIRHKNVVQFLGACTRPPNLCIMLFAITMRDGGSYLKETVLLGGSKNEIMPTSGDFPSQYCLCRGRELLFSANLSVLSEFMSRGSVYNFLHKQRGAFKLSTLLKVAIDVSKGMNYLHQNNIIHRDLKTANLLMDENEVVKLPYMYLTPLQAAVGVVQKGLRPTIPKNTHPKLAEVLESCWQQNPSQRPNFSLILENLQQIAKEVGDGGEDQHKDKSIGGFFSSFRRGHH